MQLRHYSNLRNFVVVAEHDSLSTAADRLCLTKGALSHQIRQLEAELGFSLFERHVHGIRLSTKGKELLTTVQQAFEQIEHKSTRLAADHERILTIGTTT